MNNLDDALRQLRDAGLQVDHLIVDGAMHRCRVEGMDRERRGWYCLHEWTAANGERYVVGTFGVWQGNDNGAQKLKLTGQTMNDAERAALRARMAEDRKRATAARKREAQAAARRAEAVWRKARTTVPEDGAVDYLTRKDVQSFGLRYTDTGTLIVPMQDARGEIHGLQFILPSHHPRRAKTGRDKEYWPPGLQKQGHWFQIGAVAQGGIVLVAEGYATAATCHAATGLPVAVAFDAGNLRHVAAAIKAARHTDKILILADDDYLQRCRACRQPTPVVEAACQHCGEPHGAENAGLRDAQAAALQVNGAVVAPAFPEDRTGRKLTDFNDLQHAPGGGLHLVREQILAKLDALGWREGAAPRRGHGGEGGGESTPVGVDYGYITEDVLLEHFRLILTTEDYFDHRMRRVWSHGALLKATARGVVNHWASRRDRKYCLPEQVGFDPDNSQPEILCNLYDGWPTEPAGGKCHAILRLLDRLCAHEANASIELAQWVLNWLAFMVQHPGAKMATSIIVHGDQGGGKNLFFGRAVKPIFGKYGVEFGQNAIEEKYNDWMSAKLFGIGNEVIASHESLYHMKGYIKNIITESVLQIRPMHHSARQERNCLNMVFLSNELQPMNLERGDRRFCVIWTPATPAPGDDGHDDFRTLITDVLAELANGGSAALHQFLLDRDTRGFHEGTPPPITRAKDDLIEISLDSKQRFWEEWSTGQIPHLPCVPVPTSLLFEAYRAWCGRVGVRSPAPQAKLIPQLAKQRGVRKTQERYLKGQSEVNERFVLPRAGDSPPPSMTRSRWIGECVEQFRDGLAAYRGENYE